MAIVYPISYDTMMEVWYKCVERIVTIEYFGHARHFVHVPIRDVAVEGARVKNVSRVLVTPDVSHSDGQKYNGDLHKHKIDDANPHIKSTTDSERSQVYSSYGQTRSPMCLRATCNLHKLILD